MEYEISKFNPCDAVTVVRAAATYTAEATAVAAARAAADAAAETANRKQTADICREVLTESVFEKIQR